MVVNIIDGILIYIYYPAQQFRLSFRLNIDAASFSHFTAILARTMSRLSFLTLAFFFCLPGLIWFVDLEATAVRAFTNGLSAI